MNKYGLVMYGIVIAFSFAGWLVFDRGGSPQLTDIAPSLVAAAGAFFAQLQIALAAAILFVHLGRRTLRSLVPALAAIFVASLFVESAGVAFGVPFGSYQYADALGWKLPGGVPWTIPLSWATTTTAAYLLVSTWRPKPASGFLRIGATSLLLLAWDLTLDPAMSTVNGFWIWATPGGWYGVPFSNLAGWYLSGLLFAAILEALSAHRLADDRERGWLLGFLALNVSLPLAMLLAEGMWGAALSTLVLAALIVFFLVRKAHRAPPGSSAEHPPETPEANLDFLGKNSKTFRFASSFLSKDAQRLVAGVYGWCRVSDDLVDEAVHLPREQVRVRLDAWLDLSRAAYDGRETGIALLDRLFGEMRTRSVPFDHAQDLIDGLRMDLEPARYCDEGHLRTYSYRVASTIGVWLVRSTGIDSPWVLERAEALGHAMQLTNILRDVGDDLRMGRVYIPLEDLAAAGLSEDDLRGYSDGTIPLDKRWAGLMETLMERADRDYALAYEAMPALPTSFRFGVAVAASVYQGIHGAIRANGYDNFRHRAVVGPLAKCALATKGLWRLQRALPPRDREIPVALGNAG